MKVGDMPSEPRDELHLEIECAEYPILSTVTPTSLYNKGRGRLSAVACDTRISFHVETSYIHHMNPWSKRPGKKVSVPRFSLESWAQHMADPIQNANMLREHARSIREQLKLLDKRKG